jgi:hypothetical protein
MLVQADRQKNLEGRFEIDAVPQAGRVYYRNADQTEKARVGRTNQTPNMYERSRGDGEAADGTEDGELTELDDELEAGDEAEPGVASLSDARTESASKKKNPFSLGLFGKNSPDKKPYDPFALFKRKRE